jgi:hypothetical protein
MFIDADEYFDEKSLGDLIDFFSDKSKRKKYQTVAYKILNYINAENTEYTSMYGLRIGRNTPTLHFKNAVHEQLTISQPVFYSNSFVHHYGYTYESIEQKEIKFKRNRDILLTEFEQDPDSIRILCQLSDVTVDKDECLEYVHRAVEAAKKSENKVMPYISAIRRTFIFREYDKLVSYADEFLSLIPENSVAVVETYGFKADALLRDADTINEGIFAAKKYFDGYHKYKNDELDNTALVMQDMRMLSASSITRVKGIYYAALAFQKRDEEFSEIFADMDVVSSSMTYFKAFFGSIKTFLSKHNNHTGLAQFYAGVLTTENEEKIKLVEEYLLYLYGAALNDIEKGAIASGIVSACDKVQSELVEFFRLAAHETDIDFVEKLQNIVDTEPLESSEVLYFALKYNVNLTCAIKRTYSDKLKSLLESVVAIHNADYNELIADFCMRIKVSNDDIAHLSFAVNAMQLAMSNVVWKSKSEDDDTPLELKSRIFNLFASLTAAYVFAVYNPNVLYSQLDALPELHRFGFHIGIAQGALAAGDQVGYVRGLKEALKTAEGVKDVIVLLLDEFKASSAGQ